MNLHAELRDSHKGNIMSRVQHKVYNVTEYKVAFPLYATPNGNSTHEHVWVAFTECGRTIVMGNPKIRKDLFPGYKCRVEGLSVGEEGNSYRCTEEYFFYQREPKDKTPAFTPREYIKDYNPEYR